MKERPPLQLYDTDDRLAKIREAHSDITNSQKPHKPGNCDVCYLLGLVDDAYEVINK